MNNEYKGIITKSIINSYNEVLVIDIIDDKLYKYLIKDDCIVNDIEMSYMQYLNDCKEFIYEDDIECTVGYLIDLLKERDIYGKYIVYRDLKDRGFVIKTGFKYGSEFRLYNRGGGPGQGHSDYLVKIIFEDYDINALDFASYVRVSHGVNKKLLLAIVDDDLDRVLYDVDRRDLQLKVFSYALLELGNVDHRVSLCYSDVVAELADSFRSIASAADACDGRHPGIVPAVNDTVVNELLEKSLGHYGVGYVESCKFSLLGLCFKADIVNHPFVKRSVVFKLNGAKGVGYSL